ncbi:branched-chain amino acid ABC transporter permease [Mesobacterium pallidum]|uniref:branched-chain amino acid ABC transporter permease n=1 Tax=Mesobacterium pallidum TaxID=2872037 RepID=UPI001EE292D7|nr:branched-chain amino acid ABC transporter permease [Mesobacterium pallidum]
MTPSHPMAETALHPLGFSRARFILFVVTALAVVIAPFVLYPIFLMKIYCFIIFAVAYNLLLGYTGLMSFGHAAFWGMGAYLTAYSAANWGFGFEAALLTGTVTGAALGLIFGLVAIRRTGLYFAMITLALAQMVYFICLQSPFTGGEDGVQGVPRGSLLGLVDLNNDWNLYWLVGTILLGTIILSNRVVHSPFGQVLRAIRNNPARAKSLGYNVDRYKLCAFVMSAALAGFAGGLKAIIFQIATLTDVSTVASTEAVLITLVGGIGTIFGPAVGSIIVLSLEHYLAPFGPWVMFTQGVVFVFFVLVFRKGLLGEFQSYFKTSL